MLVSGRVSQLATSVPSGMSWIKTSISSNLSLFFSTDERDMHGTSYMDGDFQKSGEI